MADFSDIDNGENGGGDTSQQQEEQKLHPSWQPAFDAIPADLRDTPWTKELQEQIRTSERNARKAIEDAKGQGVPEEWRGFIQAAQQQDLTVDDITEGFNTSYALRQQIAEDPDGFLESMTNSIREGVKAGRITAREGSKLMQAANEAADEVSLEGETPQDKAIRELKEQMSARDRRDFEAQQEWQAEQENQQAIAEAEAAGERFITAANAAFEAHGLAERPGNAKAIIAQVAAQYIDDVPGISEKDAMERAIGEFQQHFGLQVTAGAGARKNPPVGGGSNAVAGEEPQHFGNDRDGEKKRTDAMMAELQRLAASGE